MDEIVGISSRRTANHHVYTERQARHRKETEAYGGYFRYVASFLAQRACHTAQANALLLRHGFQEQAFELWRTMMNLRDNLENLMGEDPEKEAEKFLNATASEMKYLDQFAKNSGATLGRMFDVGDEKSINDLMTELQTEYGKNITRKDGWKNNDHPEPDNWIDKSLKAELDYHYQLASKLQHGSPISTMIGADFEMRPLRNPLEHDTEGVPLQCLLTAYLLHQTVTMFCVTTEETQDDEEEMLMGLSESALYALATLQLR